jgi:hypothetical protein
MGGKFFSTGRRQVGTGCAGSERPAEGAARGEAYLLVAIDVITILSRKRGPNGDGLREGDECADEGIRKHITGIAKVEAIQGGGRHACRDLFQLQPTSEHKQHQPPFSEIKPQNESDMQP